jgi:uncharacterized protein
MQITLDTDPRLNLIRRYAAGEVHVGERILRASCIITADAIVEEWRPDDLEALFALKPDVVLLGKGEVQEFPPAALRAAFAERKIGLEAMTLGAACRTYNILVQEGRRVAAALVIRHPGESRDRTIASFFVFLSAIIAFVSAPPPPCALCRSLVNPALSAMGDMLSGSEMTTQGP